MSFRFFVGTHHPRRAGGFDNAFVSINALRHRPNGFHPNRWVMDSGAFTQISQHGCYTTSVEEYAADIRRFARCGQLLAAVAQDFMCEAWVLERTGLTIADHQRLTIERYDALVACDVAGVYIMPVLQGFDPADYAAHVRSYGHRLAPGAWVGVGSVCKRNADPEAILAVLDAIHAVRPDLRLHGFGLKKTALEDLAIVSRLATADSMAWSFSARRQGRDPNDYREACHFERLVLEWAGQDHGELARAREEREWAAIVAAAGDRTRCFDTALVELLPPLVGKGDVKKRAARAERDRWPSVSEMMKLTD